MVPSRIPLAIVAAVGRNGAIGRRGGLPWTMPGDLARFRALTIGKPVIMGRLTLEAIGRVLPGRESIVVTRSRLSPAPRLWVAGDEAEALRLARERARAMGADEVILAGGATLFASMMAGVERLRMTFVDLAPEADVFFPPIDDAVWREEAAVVAPRHPGDDAACRFVDFVRRSPEDLAPADCSRRHPPI